MTVMTTMAIPCCENFVDACERQAFCLAYRCRHPGSGTGTVVLVLSMRRWAKKVELAEVVVAFALARRNLVLDYYSSVIVCAPVKCYCCVLGITCTLYWFLFCLFASVSIISSIMRPVAAVVDSLAV
jgi:hypothetical protein